MNKTITNKKTRGGSAGNPIAGRWARFLAKNPDVKQEYNAIKGRPLQEAYRQKWARGQYQKFTQEKFTLKSIRVVTLTSPSLSPLAKLLWMKAVAKLGGRLRVF